jgi:YhcH/YjgK/YiaL family protein
MIIDRMNNAADYKYLGKNFATAFKWLASNDLESMAAGKIEIDGKNVYATVMENDPKLPSAGKWEAHKKYADIQFIIKGEEKIGYAHISRTTEVSYDEVKDFILLSATGDYFVRLVSGDFAILFPQDGHLPGIAGSDGATAKIKKIVVKVKLEV